jgi:outer membrane receptor for ferrienterochelin and colicins
VIDNYHTKYKNEEALESYSLDYDESFFNQSLYKAELRSIYEINQKNKLILGIGYSEESLKRNNFFQDKVSQNSNNYFIQYEGFILENTNYIFGARYDQYDEYDSEFSPRFALRTQLSNNLSSKFSIGKGFKTPDFRQLYFNFSNSNSGYSVVGFNAAKQIINDLLSQGQISNLIITESQFEGQLEPETSVSYNLGLNFKINTNISFDINLFKNQIKNLIDYKIIATKINGQNIFSYYNLDRAYTQGIEFNSTFKLNNNLSLNTGYQYLDSKENDVKKRIKSGEVYARVNTVSSSFKIKTDDYFGLFNRSKHNINTKITFIKDDFQIYFKTKYRSKYGLIDSNGNDILDNYDEFVKGNFISDISVSKKIKSLNITLGLDNIFNYKDPQNVPNNPGRVLYSKITITI